MLLGHRHGHTGRMRNLAIACATFASIGIMGLGFWTAGTLYYQYENRKLQDNLAAMEALSADHVSKLETVIDKEKDARVVVGLPDIHPDVREVGVGGVFHEPVPNDRDTPESRSIVLQNTLDQLTREARLSMASLDEIEQQAEQTQEYWDGVPTVKPVTGITTSRFGMRNDPFTGLRRMHNGVDIGARKGTPVHTTANGVISQTGLNAYLGLFVEVDHQNGLITRYGHLSAVHVSAGQEVTRRTVIGEVGRTGRANGYHLHYEVKRHGTSIDPNTHFWPEKVIVN